MSDKVESCPWCKHVAALARTWASYVECRNENCGATGPMMGTAEAAISAWNEVAGLRAEVERIVAEKRSLRDRVERDSVRYRGIVDALKDHGLDARGVVVLKAKHDEMLRILTDHAVLSVGLVAVRAPGQETRA